MHHIDDLIRVFNTCFESEYNTRLVKGGEEPLYLPADESRPYHAIYFAHGFFSSALHECAHWLIAGSLRRLQVDYGYWYAPDGRTPEQQLVFQQVEIKPQALEWILADAAKHRFQLSIDNLNGSEIDTAAFHQAVYAQKIRYLQDGLSPRARRLQNALAHFYGEKSDASRTDYA